MTRSDSCRSWLLRFASWMLLLPLLAAASARSAPPGLTVDATDAIHLAGRDDVTIPAIGGNLAGFPLDRPDAALGQVLETRPTAVDVTPGEMLSFLASGNAIFSPSDLPSGADGDVAKDVLAVGGIAGYVGPGGSLVGVFLDDAIPLASPPASLDFSALGIGTSFAALSPEPGQVFFIGDGQRGNGVGARQAFDVPAGVTRLFLGTLDGAVPQYAPGYYVDNAGSFQVQVLPEPAGSAAALAAFSFLALLARARRAV